MKDQEMERKHAQPGEDVGQQGAGQDGQGGDERKAGDHQGPVPGSHGKSSRPQHQRHDPDGAAGLQDELGPEMQAFAEVEKQPEHRRAAWHEVALVPAGEVAAGVVLQQRIVIPQRRGEQHHEAAQRRGDVRDVKGAHRLSAVRGDYRITRGHCPANASRGGALSDRTGANLSIR